MNNSNRNIFSLLSGYFVDQGLHHPSILKAIFLAGGPVAGMPRADVAAGITGSHGFMLINTEDDFEHMLKMAVTDLDTLNLSSEDITKMKVVYEKAKRLTKKQLTGYVNGRIGIVIDATGSTLAKIGKQKAQLEMLGYDTYMIFINTNIDDRLARQTCNQIHQHLGSLQLSFNGKFVVVDDNAPKENKSDAVWKAAAGFARTPVTNETAVAWLNAEKENLRR